jgi:hypothetical protein
MPEQGAQRLGHRGIRQVSVGEGNAAASQHHGPGAGRVAGELLDQAGLAHPGLASDHHRCRLP